jgi:cephalosporin hydroxylase
VSSERPLSLRERAGRAVFTLLGRRRFHRLIGIAQALKATPRDPAELAAIADAVERFHVASYERGVLNDTYWFGVPIQKSPLDCWTYQEILHEQRPDLIVETGTYLGGSALFFAHLFDLLGHGRVITIDLQLRGRVEHDRVTHLEGDALSPGILSKVEAAVASARRVLVVLDDDHSAAHVLKELNAYGRFVTPGSYLVVEDTNVNGHPVFPEHGPGPMEAVRDFLATDRSFEIDRSREKFLLTYFPDGWLRKRRPTNNT